MTGFRPFPVFDASQTSGDPIPTDSVVTLSDRLPDPLVLGGSGIGSLCLRGDRAVPVRRRAPSFEGVWQK